ncbi:MAG TPA: DMT family transporter [Bacillales bacterium]|nr:DMT family transporter [Bacillales bacterium]
MRKWYIADLLLLFVAFIWGATFVMVRDAVTVLQPFTFNWLRFLLAGLFLLAWMFFFQKREIKQINRSMVFSGMIMGAWLFAGYALQTYGLEYTTPSKAGFLTGLYVVLVPLLTLLILRQKPSFAALTGVGSSVIGLFLLTAGGESGVNIGDLFEFLCAIAFAMHIVFTGKYASQFPAIALTFIQISTVAVLNGIAAIFFENWKLAFSPAVIGSSVWFALLFTSLLATVVAYLSQTALQKHTAPTHVALIFTMEPVFAALTSYLWINETLGTAAYFGCLFIFIGMILAEFPFQTFFRKALVRKKAG